MTTTRIPLVAQINVTIVSQAVTAAYGSAGDLVNYSAACSSVLLRNPGEVWPIEFKVGSGAWQRLEIYNTTLLGISLDTTTIRVRKALANSGSGLVQLDIRGLASTYLAGDDAVDLGGEGGAAAFTDLTDAPETITPNGVVCGNDAGDELLVSDAITIGELTGTVQITENGAGGVVLTASGAGGVVIAANGTGGVFLTGDGDGGVFLRGNGAGGILLSTGSNAGTLQLTAAGGTGPIQFSPNETGGIKVDSDTAVAAQSVLVAGVGTMVFTHGILTSFTPA